MYATATQGGLFLVKGLRYEAGTGEIFTALLPDKPLPPSAKNAKKEFERRNLSQKYYRYLGYEKKVGLNYTDPTKEPVPYTYYELRFEYWN